MNLNSNEPGTHRDSPRLSFVSKEFTSVSFYPRRCTVMVEDDQGDHSTVE